MGEFGKNILSGIVSSGTGIGAGLIPGIASGIAGMFGKRKAEKRAFNRQKELMALQQQYNLEAAEKSQSLALDMFEKTGYEAQVRQMKEAGLNPALMYGGGGGAGGTTLGAGKMEGPEQATGGAMAVQMGLQAELQKSQINLTNAEAAKAMAEAGKAAGVDTEKTKSDIWLNEAEEAFKRSAANLNNTRRRLGNEEIENVKQERKKLVEETRKLAISNDVDERTKMEKITSILVSIDEQTAKVAESIARTKLDEKQWDYLVEQITWYSYNALTSRMNAEAALSRAESFATDVANNNEIWGRKLDIEDEKLLKEWIYGGIHEANTLIKTILDQIPTSKLADFLSKLAKKTATSTKHEQPKPTEGKSVTREEYQKILKRALEGDETAKRALQRPE